MVTIVPLSSGVLTSLNDTTMPSNKSFIIDHHVHVCDLHVTFDISTTNLLTLFQHLLTWIHKLINKVKGIHFEFVNNSIS